MLNRDKEQRKTLEHVEDFNVWDTSLALKFGWIMKRHDGDW